VFVYGTLRAGEVNDIRAAATRHGIAPPTLIGTASVRGRLFDFGDAKRAGTKRKTRRTPRHPGLCLR
jgi:gamma-glutamylcyclotransferase (GGCT)/AIG2-like uncharacterized protein YtfP